MNTQVFYYEHCEIFKNTYFEEHLRKAGSEVTVIDQKLK